MRTSWPWLAVNALFLACGGPTSSPVVAPTEAHDAGSSAATSGAPSTTPRPFDRAAAARALGIVDLKRCWMMDVPSGKGHVVVTFGPDGHVVSAVIDERPAWDFAEGAADRCIVDEFSTARVPPFDGPPVQVGTGFAVGADSSGNTVPFNRGEAARALGSVDLGPCKSSAGPTGSGHVILTFGTDGQVVAAVVDGGPFPNTSVGACISTAFRNVRVPAFGGPPVRVGKSFVIP